MSDNLIIINIRIMIESQFLLNIKILWMQKVNNIISGVIQILIVLYINEPI